MAGIGAVIPTAFVGLSLWGMYEVNGSDGWRQPFARWLQMVGAGLLFIIVLLLVFRAGNFYCDIALVSVLGVSTVAAVITGLVQAIYLHATSTAT